jgi:uncharacterized membrane protein YhaH (DUF805 family)
MMIDFTDAIKLFYSNYFKFAGRSTRAEYWWVQLYLLLVIVLLVVITFFLMGDVDSLESGDLSALPTIPIVLLVVFMLANILPGLALQIRRFHDLNQTGWLVLVFALLGLIPLLGTLTAIGQIVWFCFRGTNGDNKYGPDPLVSGFVVDNRSLHQKPRDPMFKS